MTPSDCCFLDWSPWILISRRPNFFLVTKTTKVVRTVRGGDLEVLSAKVHHKSGPSFTGCTILQTGIMRSFGTWRGINWNDGGSILSVDVVYRGFAVTCWCDFPVGTMCFRAWISGMLFTGSLWSFTHKPLFVDIRQDRHCTTVSSTVGHIMDQDPETCILWSDLSSQCLEQSKHNTLFPQRKYRHRKHMVGIRDFTVNIRKYIYLLQ